VRNTHALNGGAKDWFHYYNDAILSHAAHLDWDDRPGASIVAMNRLYQDDPPHNQQVDTTHLKSLDHRLSTPTLNLTRLKEIKGCRYFARNGVVQQSAFQTRR
jgi:hypothetical protein